MAQAKKNVVVKEVEKVVVTKEDVVTVELSLSMEEAQVLIDILGDFVLGPFEGRRKYAHSIYDALDESGVYVSAHEDIQGEIRFK